MNRLPTGLYQPGDSALHHLDALSKLLCLIILLVAVVNTTTLPGYAALALMTALLIRISKVRPGDALHSAARLGWFFLIILLMNLFFYEPEHPWFSWWIFRPSAEGLMQGVNVVARVFLLLVFSNLLTITTAPLEMTGAMERMFSPLRFLGVPTSLRSSKKQTPYGRPRQRAAPGSTAAACLTRRRPSCRWSSRSFWPPSSVRMS